MLIHKTPFPVSMQKTPSAFPAARRTNALL